MGFLSLPLALNPPVSSLASAQEELAQGTEGRAVSSLPIWTLSSLTLMMLVPVALSVLLGN